MPYLELEDWEMTMSYGLEEDKLPVQAAVGMFGFKFWSELDVNTERGRAFVGAVQAATMQTHLACIRAMLGYCHWILGFALEALTLHLYARPDVIMNFLAFLRARGVGKGHILKHCSLAKKINDYLKSGTREDSPARRHAVKMQDWIGRIETQLSLSMPTPAVPDLPSHEAVRSWVMFHVAQAKALLQKQLRNGCVPLSTYRMVSACSSAAVCLSLTALLSTSLSSSCLLCAQPAFTLASADQKTLPIHLPSPPSSPLLIQRCRCTTQSCEPL